MSKNYTTNTSSLKASMADITKLNVKQLNVTSLKTENGLDNVLELPNEYHIMLGATIDEDNHPTDELYLILDENKKVHQICNTEYCTDTQYMFSDYIDNDLEFKYDLPNVTNTKGMFMYGSLKSYDGALPKVTSVVNMFYGVNCTFTFNSNDISSLRDASAMFKNSQVTSISLDLGNVTVARQMCLDCRNLYSFDCSIQSVTNANSMFSGCAYLQVFNQPQEGTWHLSDVTDMFKNCRLNQESIPHIKRMLYNNQMSTDMSIDLYVLNDMPTILSVASEFSVPNQSTSAVFANKDGYHWNINFIYN